VLKIIKNLLKNIFYILFKGRKFSIILNYHRIGNIDPKNPFHRLHTVSLSTFKLQIRICSLIGKFVSIDDIQNSKLNSKLSFCVTFDDVSSSIYNAIKWLDEKNIPFAICPCQQITEETLGWRDKVYFIEKYLDKKDIIKKIKESFPEISFNEENSFYSLSKDLKFDQYKMINDVVNPFYNKINSKIIEKNSEKNYFNSGELVNLKNQLKNIKFVNHSYSHANLTQLNTQQLFKEIDSCDKFLKNLLNEKPSYFAVPFGGFNFYLCVRLNEAARMSNKRAIFWVANRINLDVGYKPNKVKQFCRFHTSTSVIGLCVQIIISFFKPHFIEEINQIRFKTETKKSNIVFNPNISKILAFEDFLRPTKDYSGNSNFIKSTYINNPYLGKGKHTIAEMQNDCITAIGQNLILPFNGLEKEKNINLFANYRSIKGISKMAATILIKATQEYKLSVSYKPSKIAEPLLVKLGWNSIPIKQFTFNLNKMNSFDKSFKFLVKHDLDNVNNSIQYNSTSNDIIQLNLSKELLQWRVQNYELANPVYFIWEESSEEKAFVIAQYNKKEILLLDQRFSSIEVLEKIFNQIIHWSKTQKLSRLIAETSCIKTQTFFESMSLKQKPNIKNELCYFSPYGVFQELKNKEIIITPLSTDILLR
tara:strand:- start:1675 stop:3618 length:1944 start_codon:yes stop_codon:yes gene_type:complete